MWLQKEIRLSAKARGFHLVTAEVVRELPELADFNVGLAHILIKHTSAALTLNENADPTVRDDFGRFFNRLVPENEPYYVHTDEGPDDIPAHVRASSLGSTLSLPITQGRFNLGIWQGIYLCEHRNYGGERTLLVTLQGE